MATLATFGAWFSRHIAAFRFGARVVVAGLASFAIAQMLDLAQGYWAVFTAVIVLQASVGASLKASIDRLIGTIGGAVYGGAIVYFLPHAGFLSNLVALAIALLPLGVLAAIDDRFRVAPVTAVILLLVPSTAGVGPLAFTGDRILEIAIGGLVAVVVSLLVLPARAHGLLAEAVTRLLDRLADLMPKLLGDAAQGVDRPTVAEAQPAIRAALARLEAAAEEARRERRIHLTSDPDPDPVVRTSTRIRNDLIMISRALSTPPDAPLGERLGPFAARVATVGAPLLRAIAAAFQSRTAPPALDAFEGAIRAFSNEVAAIRAAGLTRPLSAEAASRLFALTFAVEQLGSDVKDLAARAAEFAAPGTEAARPAGAA